MALIVTTTVAWSGQAHHAQTPSGAKARPDDLALEIRPATGQAQKAYASSYASTSTMKMGGSSDGSIPHSFCVRAEPRSGAYAAKHVLDHRLMSRMGGWRSKKGGISMRESTHSMTNSRIRLIGYSF